MAKKDISSTSKTRTRSNKTDELDNVNGPQFSEHNTTPDEGNPEFKNNKERYVLISNYRNLGLTSPVKVVLNRSTEPGMMGDLVFLVGPNNSGKSNIIDAIESLRTGTSDEDIPEMAGHYVKPSVDMVGEFVSDYTNKDDDPIPPATKLYNYLNERGLSNDECKAIENFVYSGKYSFIHFDRLFHYTEKRISRSDVVDMINGDAAPALKTLLCRMITHNPQITSFSISDMDMEINHGWLEDTFLPFVNVINVDDYLEMCDIIRSKKLDPTEEECILDLIPQSYIFGKYDEKEKLAWGMKGEVTRDEIIKILKNPSKGNFAKNVICRLLLNNPHAKVFNFSAYDGIDDGADKSLYDPFIRISPSYAANSKPPVEDAKNNFKILRYAPNIQHKQSELKSDIHHLNTFMLNLMKMIGYSQESFDNVLDNYKRMHDNDEVLRMFERELSSKMEKINEQFNDMYGCNRSKYKLNIYVNPDMIKMNIRKGNVPITLDNQSAGFQWFFDFFFFLILGKKLKPGDIVMMDEPATNLHVRGQIELRSVMKEFAVKNQVTFVISTHSPFLIDCDYLDEIRIVRREDDGESVVKNNFQTFLDDDYESRDFSPDLMDDILQALTVGRHVMRDPDSALIFVEGITDYNYLTAFAKLLKVDNISFMPINGLLNEDLGRKLHKFSKDPLLLVDADEAGYIAKERYDRGENSRKKNSIDVIALSDIDESFRGDYDYSNFNEKKDEDRGFCIEDLFSEEDRTNILKNRKESDFSSIFKSYIHNFEDVITDETKENFSKIFEYFKQEFLL